MKTHKVHLSGRVTRHEKHDFTGDLPVWDGIYTYHNCKGKIFAVRKALENAYRQGNWNSVLITLTFPDDYDRDTRFKFRRLFTDAFRKFMKPNEYYYLSTAELTVKGKVHFHFAVMFKGFKKITEWVCAYGTKKGHPNMIDTEYVKGLTKFKYICKYVCKFDEWLNDDYIVTNRIDEYFDSPDLIEKLHNKVMAQYAEGQEADSNDKRILALYKCYITSCLQSPHKLWTYKIPYKKQNLLPAGTRISWDKKNIGKLKEEKHIFVMTIDDHYKYLKK